MRRQLLFALAAAVLVAGLALSAAEAKPRQALSFMLADITFGSQTDQCPAGTVDFAVQSQAGAALGAGSGCLKAIHPAGAKSQRARVILTLWLAGGSVTIDTRLREVFLNEGSLVQVAHGKVVAGTGGFAGSHGRLRGAGTVVLNPDGSADSNVVFVLVFSDEGQDGE